MISTMGRWITPGMGEDAVIAKWGLTDDAYDEIMLSLPYSTIPGPSDVDNILTIVLKHLSE